MLFAGLGFSLQPGGFLLLKGGNGVGKTTLLQTLCGLRRPDTGKISWCGKDISDNRDFRRELTYIGHKNGLMLDATVEENVNFWATLHDTKEMAAPAISYFGLDAKKDKVTGTLSSGWQRRAALCRLLLSPATIWILDEPTNFLDEEAIELIGQLIETRVTHGGIVIAASHTMSSAFSTHMLQLEDFLPCEEGSIAPGSGISEAIYEEITITESEVA